MYFSSKKLFEKDIFLQDKLSILAVIILGSLSHFLYEFSGKCVIFTLLDQGLMYAARLEDAGVEVKYHILKGMVHGFLNWTYG